MGTIIISEHAQGCVSLGLSREDEVERREKSNIEDQAVDDPVCGMGVRPSEAVAREEFLSTTGTDVAMESAGVTLIYNFPGIPVVAGLL